jgi:RNA polymerase sigma factor (sigma-70 family)
VSQEIRKKVEVVPTDEYDPRHYLCSIGPSPMDATQTTHLEHCIERLRTGDESARAELLNSACERLRRLARKMLKGYPRLARLEETGDVLQNAAVRLHASLKAVAPESLRHFFRLAALQIRRELIDLARHHFGPQGLGGKMATPAPGDADTPRPPFEKAETTDEPARLAVWSELHQRIETLPEPDREVFELLWYHELTQEQAAEILNVSRHTVIRRWQAACLRLRDLLSSSGFQS